MNDTATDGSGARRRVLVLGGTGAFGSRLVGSLVDTTEFHVIVGTRGAQRAAELVASLNERHPDRVEAISIDRDSLNADDLRRLQLWCVVDAAGPFQSSSLSVAEAAIAAGCHYVDLADARDFVAAFPRLDDTARSANVLAVTGASSTPAISNAVLDQLVAGWQRIDRIQIAISPGNNAPRGLSVMQAILARAGQKTRVFQNGSWCEQRGWGKLKKQNMPGLGRRWLSLVETPDLDIVVERFHPTQEAIFYAGLELSVMHVGLWSLSQLVAARLVSNLSPLARPLHWTAERLRGFGTDRGGMTVIAEGSDAEGKDVSVTWSLVAEAGDGPHIPTLPALALLRKLADGRIAETGAIPCVGLLSLADLEREFARFRITSNTIR